MAARKAYEHLCSDFPEVDAASLAALRDALSPDSAGISSVPDAFPLCVALVGGLEWAALAAARRPPAAVELAGLSAEAASAAAYAEVYAVGCVRRAAALVTAYAGGGDISGALRHYAPPARQDGAAAPSDAEVEAASARLAASALAPEEAGQSGGAQEDEVWATDPDDDAMPYEPLARPVASADGAGHHPQPALASAHQPPRVLLEHLVASLSYAPLSSLPSPAAWSHASLGATINEAVRALADAAATGTLSAAAAERLAWPLLALVRERLRSLPDTCEAELPAVLGAAGAAWRPRFLASLLGDGGLLLAGGASPRAYTAVEAAVRTELPALMGGLAAGASGGGATSELLLSLLGCFLEPPKAHAARAAEALLASGAPQLLLQRRMGMGAASAADESAEWRWLLRACCRHRPLLAFAARVPPLLSAVRTSAHLQARESERLAWLWILAVERRQAATAAAAAANPPAAAAAAAASVNAEIESEALVALQAACHEACAARVGEGGAELRPESHLPRQADSLLFLLELFEMLSRAANGAFPPRDLLLSAVGAPFWSELEAFGRKV